MSDLIRRFRGFTGEASQNRIVLKDLDAEAKTNKPISEFFRDLLTDAERYSKRRVGLIGLTVFTGVDITRTTLIGSANNTPRVVYTDGTFQIVKRFPDNADKGSWLYNPELAKLDKLRFNSATYVGWMAGTLKAFPEYYMQTPMLADQVREVIKNANLGFGIDATFDAKFRG